MGIAQEDCAKNQEALDCYKRAIELRPQFDDALHNRGLLLARLGWWSEAEHAYREYASARPASVRAWNGLADVQLALDLYDEAVQSLDAALRLAPEDAPTLVRRGIAMACLRRFRDAQELFDSALRRSPAEAASFIQRAAPGAEAEMVLSPQNIFLSRAWAALGRCDWRGWDAFVGEMRATAGTRGVRIEPAVAFMAQHLPLSGFERHGIARRIAEQVESRVTPLPAPPPRSRSKLRIGILSPDYREHLNAYLLLPLFELADRRRFEMYAYSLSPEDGSAARARIRAAADAFRDVHAMQDRQAAQAIRADDVDLLIDAAGHTTGGRFSIIAQRPARAQALYLGFSGSLASSRVDYAIVDTVVATQDAEWSEQLLCLPHTWFLYDFRARVPETKLTRADYGLPTDAFVYCAFHRAEKISPDLFELWMRILAQVPRSVLWCLALPETAKGNLRTEAATRGIDPARLVFAPFEPRHGDRYLPRQRLGDLMLDSLYHNAMTTACDALGSGLPVLTLKGSALAARGGASLVTAAGIPELVVADREAYVAEAVALARDPKRLARYREKLFSREGPLFDTAARVRELEACLAGMVGQK